MKIENLKKRNMVLLHFKKTEGNEFLYETNMQINIDVLTNELCECK